MRPTIANVSISILISAVLWAFVALNGALLIIAVVEDAGENSALSWVVGVPAVAVAAIMAGAAIHSHLRLRRVRRSFPEWTILTAIPRRPLGSTLGPIMNDAGFELPQIRSWDLFVAVKVDRLGFVRSRDDRMIAEFPAERIAIEVGVAVDLLTLVPVSRVSFDGHPPIVFSLPIISLCGFASRSRKYHRATWARAGLSLSRSIGRASNVRP